MEYLGFWVTRDGVKTIHKKIQEIKNIKPPTYQKELRQFIYVAIYYHYIRIRCPYTLGRLTDITYIKMKLKWTKIEEDAFDEIKRIVVSNKLLAYQDFNG